MLLQIQTDRLKLLPFTIQICEEVLSSSTSCLTDLGISPAKDWPDLETLDTLPRILKNLNKVQSPSGFESWMVIHKSTNILIGDIGFKGSPNEYGEIDLGYGIVQSETQKGYAKEAALGLIEWAFKQAGIKAITANCSKENFTSQKILTFLNFTKIEEHQEMLYWKLLSNNSGGVSY
ncbi:GNAT family N-acetyltransferase [Pedobacter nutrimenti]|uniref:Ribosomal-protein-alanine N-acetyltransferase n=1 Tax=Pedobacter nutrimenti TaxID=1241337 RepID=A0A318UCI2_9SPHI|nr:GNAT family N-acetyltransferase [Pedobacter nutrimenti]PYF74086.1 ribosomal-protein-alanine N-acetyltransferase [Pedobacter nutrimenti]